MSSVGRSSLFFDNCTVRQPGVVPPIEELGTAFGTYLEGLRYTDAQPVPQVDVIAHSMGGLIVRSYLAGKQTRGGVFQPPVNVRVRRMVFLGTPHFGSFVPDLALRLGAQLDMQSLQLQQGSDFLWDLNTWNQGTDDLRGLPAVNVAGDAGGGLLAGVAGLPDRYHDGVVMLSSAASLAPVRVLRYCHTTGDAEQLCSGGEGFLARFTDSQHQAARIAISFLSGNADWMSIGRAAEATPLSNQGGIWIRSFDATGNPVNITAQPLQPSQTLSIRNNRTAWSERLQSGEFLATVNGRLQTLSVPAGRVGTVVVKPGPVVGAAIPTFALVTPRVVAPGEFISIYGTDFSSAAFQATAQPYPTMLGPVYVILGSERLRLHYAGPTQINAIVPAQAPLGLQTLVVTNETGFHAVQVLVERTAPAVYGTAVNALTSARVTPEAPIRRGEYLSFYLTGLGVTDRRADGLDWARETPTVQLGTGTCAVSYAGRSPGYEGLDQINCQVPENITCTDCAVTVRTGGKTSNTIQVPVRP